MKFLKFLGARRFGLRTAERRFEILKFLNARHFGSHKQAAEFLKFASEPLRNRSEILNFAPKLRNGLEILKFTRASAPFADTAQNFISQRGFKILKLVCEPPHALRNALTRALLCTSLRADKAEAGRAARLTSQHTYDATEKRRMVKLNQYLNSARRRIARLRSAAARHGHEVGRAEKLSKFNLISALLNFKSRFTMQLCSAITRRNYEAWRSEIYAVCLHKYSALIRAASDKISRYEVGRATNALLSRGVQRMKFYALNRHTMKFLKFLGASRFGSQTAACFLKFKPESSHSRSGILNFMFASYKLKLAVRKFKSAPAVRLNFALNSIPPASASKFENGVKFKGAAKFERSAR